MKIGTLVEHKTLIDSGASSGDVVYNRLATVVDTRDDEAILVVVAHRRGVLEVDRWPATEVSVAGDADPWQCARLARAIYRRLASHKGRITTFERELHDYAGRLAAHGAV